MIKIDLITGFLGAGKTTFIKQYAQYLISQGNKIGIIENDFGAVNVDMMLLQELMSDQCALEMITSGDCECHRRRLKAKLIAKKMQGFDRIIIEPSGIYEIDEFFDLLYEEPLNNWYEISNVIAIVDAKLNNDLSPEENYLLASQIANAGKVILSRFQKASDDEVNQTLKHLDFALKQVKCPRQIQNSLLLKDWHTFQDQDYEDILNSEYVIEDYHKLYFDQHDTFMTLYFMDIHLNKQALIKTIQAIINDEDCGKVLRIKGFMQDLANEDQWLELNATKHEIKLNPIKEGQAVIILIGKSLQENKIAAYFVKAKETL